MAERGSREGSTRRQSFRRSLAEAALPAEYLDALEQKRKQLDESIHKYIAAKERDYKQYEKELRQQYSSNHDTPKEGSKIRRTSSESTQEIAAGSPRILGQQQTAVDVLLSAGLKREQIGQPVAIALRDGDEDGVPPTIEAKSVSGLTDRRASIDRNKEFVGVFTPTFLPALENGRSQHHGEQERGASAPPASNSGKARIEAEHGMQRANSDSLADSKQRRPTHLQFIQRTSSSGSSVDGKLTSAMKSPTHPRPKRKRVSIAVGDSIVAPSDNVPFSMDNHSIPSHSRTRSPAAIERESRQNTALESLRGVQRQPLTSALSSQFAQSPQPAVNGTVPGSEIKAPEPNTSAPRVEAVEAKQGVKSVPPIIPTVPAPSKAPRKVDPDGDLFDLEEDDESQAMLSDAIESEDEITGRVNTHAKGDELDDENAGLISESDERAEHVEFVPGSANASQQPIDPGFRRPSVSSDPIYMGDNYDKAENDAVTNDVYGSSFARPSKGSFTAGSLGESFMARNAEMMRNRASPESAQARS